MQLAAMLAMAASACSPADGTKISAPNGATSSTQTQSQTQTESQTVTSTDTVTTTDTSTASNTATTSNTSTGTATHATETIEDGSIALNDGATTTASLTVTATIAAPANAAEMMLTESSYPVGGTWEKVATSKSYTFTNAGLRTLRVFFRTQGATATSLGAASSITIDTTAPLGVCSTLSPQGTKSPSFICFATDAVKMAFAVSESGLATAPEVAYATTYVSDLYTWDADGAKQLWYRFSDAVGNKSAAKKVDFAIDTTAPNITSFTVASSGGATKSKTPAFSFTTSEPIISADFSCDGTQFVTKILPTSPFSGFDITTAAAGCSAGDGARTISFRVKDQAAQASSVQTVAVTLDTAAPAAPTIDTLPAITNNSALTISGTTEAGSTIVVTLNGAALPDVTPTGTTYSKAVTLTANTSNSISVYAKDAAGNQSSAALATIAHDNVAPTISAVTLQQTATTGQIQFTTSENATAVIEYGLGGGAPPPFSGQKTITTPATSHSTSLTTLDPATDYRYRITVTDAAGNTTVDTIRTFTTYIDATYVISSNTTFSNTSNIYYVGQNLRIDPAATLTINPGVRLQFDGTEMQIRGKLVAQGTAGNHITMTSNRTTKAARDWRGLWFRAGCTSVAVDGSGDYVSGSVLDYVDIEYAGASVPAVRAEGCRPGIYNSRIRYGGNFGIKTEATSGIFMRSSEVTDQALGGVWHNAASLLITPTSDVTIRNSLISNNNGPAIKGTLLNTFELTTSTVDNNRGAVADILNTAAQAKIQDNLFRGNDRGLRFDTSLDDPLPIAYAADATVDRNVFIGTKGPAVAVHSKAGTVAISKNIFAQGIDTAITTFSNNDESSGNVTVTGNQFVAHTTGKAVGFRWEGTLPGLPASNPVNVSFNGNTFTRNVTTDTDAAMLYFTGSTGLVVGASNDNNFVGNTSAYLLTTMLDVLDPDIHADGNWWGTAVNSQAVQDRIFDYTDDSSKSLVDYTSPTIYLSAPSQTAPISSPLTFTATAGGAGIVNFTWTASTEGDCKGYRLYWDTDSGDPYANSQYINGCATTTFQKTGLPAGVTYFAITTEDTSYAADGKDFVNGHEGWFSVERTVTVP